MKKLAALALLLLATACVARTRDWKTATVIGYSETTVTSPMMRQPKKILHYTVLTEAYTLDLDYSYNPSFKDESEDHSGKHSPPSIARGEPTKLAIEGHTAYLLDVNGNEVKMHIKKKTKN